MKHRSVKQKKKDPGYKKIKILSWSSKESLRISWPREFIPQKYTFSIIKFRVYRNWIRKKKFPINISVPVLSMHTYILKVPCWFRLNLPGLLWCMEQSQPVSDPHEIANVLGIGGVDFMIENGKKIPFHFYFGAPSCVPATIFETAGAVLRSEEVDQLLSRPEIKYLSEMMNFPGVLNGDPEVMKKIASAKKHHKPVDGHAPGLRGDEAHKYIQAGISTDHECFTAEEALDKLAMGMKILIREGSAARNFEALPDY